MNADGARGKALKAMLEDLTSVYGGDRVDVMFGNQPTIATDGSQINVWTNPADVLDLDISPAAEFSLIRDTVGHEMAHYLWSDLEHKADVHASYKNDHGAAAADAAADIWNILEDAHIDARRVKQWPGMRKARSLFARSQMGESVATGDKGQAMLLGLHQISLTGTATDLTIADKDVKSFLAWARRYIQAIRDEDDADARLALQLRVIDEYLERVDNPATPDLSEFEKVGAGDAGDTSGGTPIDPDDLPEGALEDLPASPSDVDADEADDFEGHPDAQDSDTWDHYDEDADDGASRSDERRVAKLDDIEAFDATKLGDWQKGRDRREDKDSRHRRVTSEEVRNGLATSGLADDIRRAFERFKTRDVRVAAERGDELNTRNIVRHMAGDYSERNVYTDTYVGATGGRSIGVAVDLSASMSNARHAIDPPRMAGAIWHAKLALGALHIAAEAMGDDLTISGYTTKGDVGQRKPWNTLITGPGEDFEWSHLDAAWSRGGTPTANGIRFARNLLGLTDGNERVLIVLTDGNPTQRLDGADTRTNDVDVEAELYADDAAAQAEAARQSGMKVIGMAVGEYVDTEQMDRMFGAEGAGWVRTDAETLVNDLVNIYRQQLDISPVPNR